MLSVFHDSERVCICTYEWEELRSLVSHMGIYKCNFTSFESIELCWIFLTQLLLMFHGAFCLVLVIYTSRSHIMFGDM